MDAQLKRGSHIGSLRCYHCGEQTFDVDPEGDLTCLMCGRITVLNHRIRDYRPERLVILPLGKKEMS